MNSAILLIPDLNFMKNFNQVRVNRHEKDREISTLREKLKYKEPLEGEQALLHICLLSVKQNG